MLEGVQGIRAWAAIAVMLFHLGGAVASEKYFGLTWAAAFTGLGTHGVLVFFVLSGFIIHHVHGRDLGRPDRIGRYVLRRLLRLYPSYLAVFLLVAGATLVTGLGADGLPRDWWDILKTLTLWPQNKAVVGGTGAPVIIVAWSLQYEVLFYLAFAIGILNRRIGLSVATAFLLAAIWTKQSGNSTLFPGFLNWSYFLLFGLGIGVSFIVSRPISVKLARLGWRLSLLLFALAGCAQIAFALEIDHQAQLFTGTLGLLFLGFTTALLITSRAAIDLQMPTRLDAASHHLAETSYLIYLLHFPVISASCKVSLASGFTGLFGALVASAIAIPGVLILATILHALIEKPIMSFAKRIERPRRPDTQSTGRPE
jgi:exopolysaccharide production protein ExoZ